GRDCSVGGRGDAGDGVGRCPDAAGQTAGAGCSGWSGSAGGGHGLVVTAESGLAEGAAYTGGAAAAEGCSAVGCSGARRVDTAGHASGSRRWWGYRSAGHQRVVASRAGGRGYVVGGVL